MIGKKVKHGRMKIALQDAIGTIHGTVRRDVQDFVSATGVFPGTGALLEEAAFVMLQQEPLFSRRADVRFRFEASIDLPAG
jgi:hypothetical protein